MKKGKEEIILQISKSAIPYLLTAVINQIAKEENKTVKQKLQHFREQLISVKQK